jgi:4a-hydroxytetrahydrobiopterin dehydratase
MLDAAAIARLRAAVPQWEVRGDKLHRRFVFKDFVQAMRFVNRMADVAEGEGHHPDFTVHYREVDVAIWTHAVGGLTENDFILAAKIDVL